MAEGISKSEMEELFQKFFGGTKPGEKPSLGSLKELTEFKKALKENIDSMKKSLPISNQIQSILKGEKETYKDFSSTIQGLDKELETLRSTARKDLRVSDQRRISELEAAKAQAMATAASVNSRVALQNFAVGATDVIGTLMRGAFDYAKSLQGGASGVDASVDLAKTAASATGKTVGMIGNIISTLAPLAPLLARFGGTWGKIAAVGAIVLPVLGTGISVAGDALSKYGQETIDFLGNELKKTKKAFQEITSAGAVFAGGMTEMRQVAGYAGLDIAQLSTIVKDNRDNFIAMGMGLGEATKRIAGVSREIRNSELGIQLRKLGYSAEQQAGLAAEVMAIERAAGTARVLSDKEIAAQTAQYGKDLKVLADITGKDAKKAAEKARTTAMQADIMAKLGPEESKRFQAQLRGMPEALQKGFIQYIASGGQAVTDTATNVLMAQQPEVAKAFQTGLQNIYDTSKTATDVQDEAIAAGARIGKAEEQRARSGDAAINMAATLVQGVSGTISQTAEMTNQLLLQTRYTEDGAAQARQNVDAMATNMAKLDQGVALLDEQADRIKSVMGEKLTPVLEGFTATLQASTANIEEAVAKILKEAGVKLPVPAAPEREKGFNEKFGEAAGGAAGGIAAGALAGGLIGSIVPVVGTAIGTVIGGALGAWGGSALGGWIGKKFDTPGEAGTGAKVNIPKAADGKVLSGPKSGFLAMLHGTEAVVPLPNGTDIPVDIDFEKSLKNIPNLTGMRGLENVNAIEPFASVTNRLSDQFENLVESIGETNNNEILNDVTDRLDTGASLRVTQMERATTENAERTRELLIRNNSLLEDLVGILESSRSLQQQFVYNTTS